MALPPIPGNVAPYFQAASKATGLPEAVVAAQNYTESGYGSNMGPSSAGAEGPWQFLPSTYTGLGFNTSTINQWGPSTQAYEAYMKQLLHEENGNVRNALAAYNAGPGAVQQYGGVPPYAETQSYVSKVLGYAEAFRAAQPTASAAPLPTTAIAGIA